jgi:HEAT repeat protein
MSEWSDFRLDAFGEPYMVWHDGPDFSVLRERWRAEPELVERMLRLGLAEDDPLAAEAVGELGLTAFVQELEALVATSSDSTRVRLASSLRVLTGEQRWSRVLVEVLLGRDHWSTRLDAAIALRHFSPTMDLIAALVRGVEDPEYLVRYHAANSLLAWAGRQQDIADTPEFALIREDSTAAQRTEAGIGLAAMAAAVLHAS